jgi:threonine/homoserine/homoserine lactone efflux protein
VRKSREYFASSAVLFVVGVAAAVITSDPILSAVAFLLLVGAIYLVYTATKEERKENAKEARQEQSAQSPRLPPSDPP